MIDLAAWMPRHRPTREVLEGRYVRLQPLDPARHGEDLFEAGSGEGAEERWRYLFESPPPDRAAFEPWLAKAAASEDPLFYAVVDIATGRAEGRLALMRIEPNHGVIEVGSILFGPRLARTSGATEAIYLLAAHVFDDLGYRRFEWKCDDRNLPSRRAAVRFGFGFEGVFRQHMVVKGQNRDTAWYAMLDRDWPQRSGAFRLFLDPSNLDQEGRQRLRLSELMRDRLRAGEELILHRADTRDLPAIMTLQQAAYDPNRALLGAEPLPLQADYRAILGTHEVWLANGGDRLSGVLILEPTPDYLLIWSAAVAPDQQGRGLGNALLQAAEARAATLGLDTLRLYTGEPLEQNRAWYARKGYEVERIEALEDRRLVHMIRRLGDPGEGAGPGGRAT